MTQARYYNISNGILCPINSHPFLLIQVDGFSFHMRNDHLVGTHTGGDPVAAQNPPPEPLPPSRHSALGFLAAKKTWRGRAEQRAIPGERDSRVRMWACGEEHPGVIAISIFLTGTSWDWCTINAESHCRCLDFVPKVSLVEAGGGKG